jgi:hypothetical protein
MATVGVNRSNEVEFRLDHVLLFGEIVKNVRESQKQGRSQLEHRFTSCRTRLADSPNSLRLAVLRTRQSELTKELEGERLKLRDAEKPLKEAIIKGDPKEPQERRTKSRGRIVELTDSLTLLDNEAAPLAAKVASELANALIAERDTYWATCRQAVDDFDKELREFLTAHAPALASALAGCEAAAQDQQRNWPARAVA